MKMEVVFEDWWDKSKGAGSRGVRNGKRPIGPVGCFHIYSKSA